MKTLIILAGATSLVACTNLASISVAQQECIAGEAVEVVTGTRYEDLGATEIVPAIALACQVNLTLLVQEVITTAIKAAGEAV